MSFHIAAGIILAYIPYVLTTFGAGLFIEGKNEFSAAPRIAGGIIFAIGIGFGLLILGAGSY